MPARRFASMVLPEPGGPIISTLWPPAAATSSARCAPSSGRAHRGNPARIAASSTCGRAIRLCRGEFLGPRQQRHHFGQMPHAVDIAPRAPPPPRPRFRRARSDSGSPDRARKPPPKARRAPAGWRHRAKVRPPAGAGRDRCTAPIAPRMPIAMGRSNPAPSLRTLAGARLMVTRLCGIAKAGIHQRRFDALAALAHGEIGHADHGEIARRSGREHVDFDVDQVRIDAINCGAAGPE